MRQPLEAAECASGTKAAPEKNSAAGRNAGLAPRHCRNPCGYLRMLHGACDFLRRTTGIGGARPMPSLGRASAPTRTIGHASVTQQRPLHLDVK